jgi:hypothetical protein
LERVWAARTAEVSALEARVKELEGYIKKLLIEDRRCADELLALLDRKDSTG